MTLPHLVVIFVIALLVFGPQKLPELARMLGKANAEFRKMTNDFKYALEDEVRELERQTRIRDEEVAAAARAAQAPIPMPSIAPDGAVPRETPIPTEPPPAEEHFDAGQPPTDSGTSASPSEPVSAPHEKSSDDNTAV